MTPPLRLAVVHYHVRPGGVTRVIERSLEALRPHGVEAVVLCGEAPVEAPALSAPVVVVKGLGYRPADARGVPDIADALRGAARATLGAAPDLWHIHNHALGKNASLPLAVKRLAHDGERLLLHLHDFAEDGRPANYRLLLDLLGDGDPERLAPLLYPAAPHVHYAALNPRDVAFLADAGAGAAMLHELPNAVDIEPASAEPPASDARVFLYVTRAIRRKNLGEFLFWSALAEPGDRFEVSRAPDNPEQRPAYDRWVAFAAELGLPVAFETGGMDVSLADMMARSRAMVSTSVAEGFGLAFLEPWLADRPLLGRDLPEITRGITAAGVDLSGLYTRLDVPLEWVGRDTLRERLRDGLRRTFRAYGREATEADVAQALNAAAPGAHVDFGCLDEPLQERIIRRVAETGHARLDPPTLEDTRAFAAIEGNREAAGDAFGLDPYGARLMDIYRALLGSAARSPDALSARTLLDRFLAPERFRLLRSAEPVTAELIARVRELSPPLGPRPTGVAPDLRRLEGLRAVLFDVYGTLLVSACGDVGAALAMDNAAALCEALTASDLAAEPETAASRGVELLFETIEADHARRRAEGVAHPEVDIREIWRTVLGRLAEEGLVRRGLDDAGIERFAVEYEARVNPVSPMPGAREVLADLHRGGLKLGIISNAQFFTPLLFPAVVGADLDELGFDPDLRLWSCEALEAKPSTRLYEDARGRLREEGIAPEHALYVGNDMRNDVAPAQRVGFRTALFAGDARSLRLREDDPDLAAVRPDLILTRLDQLPACVVCDAPRKPAPSGPAP